jgi:MATE family multidrug resistance protein
VLLIAWPIIVSNVSTPLLGLVDTAVIGNLGDPALIGAIAVGGMIFSFLYWGFGFLRMGTTGLVAQAGGAGQHLEVKAALYRALIMASLIGVALLLLQSAIGRWSILIIDGSAAVETAALEYFSIRIMAAPFSLINLVVLGYFLGQQRSTSVLFLQILLNATNIVLDIVFVLWLGWGIAGVAAATVIAECLVFVVGIFMVIRHLKSTGIGITIPVSLMKDLQALGRTLAVNRDIMIRTLCLIFAFAWFTNQGAKSGDVLLATNAILMQFVSFSAFFLDGYALAAESLVGNAVGARSRRQLDVTMRYISELGLITAVVLTFVYYFMGPWVIDILTNVPEVRETARTFLIWVVAAPLVSLWCYMLDGVFIGATCTREMRNAMVISLAVYLGAWWLLVEFGNHGLWSALFIYFIARALSLAIYLPNVRTKAGVAETT